MKYLFLVGLLLIVGRVHADDSFLDAPLTTDQAAQSDDLEGRDPASTSSKAMVMKKSYPGAADDDDLQVQGHLPDAGLRIDARSVQREVFKGLYNQDLKEDNRESVEE